MSRGAPLVLCVHAVADDWEHPLAVRLRDLERLLRLLLAAGRRPVGAADAVAGAAGGLHVTFDDAFVSVRSALPLLRRLGVPVTVFACPGYAEDGRPFDVPELAAEAAARPDRLATLDWDGLRGLVDEGVEVQSHTLSHPHLPSLPDAELRRELVDSRRRLEDELGKPVRLLAYPFGDEDARVRAAARAAGYEAAFALPGARRRERFAVPRVGIYRRDGLVRSAAKAALAGRRQ